jgi:uncharacterized lipoprotein YajG
MLTWQTTRAATSRPAVVLALVAGLLLTGCSHASSTIAATPARTNGSVIEDAAPFCSFLTSVDEAAAQAASQKQGIRLLASIVPRLRARQAATPAPNASGFKAKRLSVGSAPGCAV